MKILMISSYLPYPLYSGGHVRLYNLLKLLALHHKITLVCEKRDHQTEADVKEVEKICHKVITVQRRKQWSLQNILKTSFSSRSFLITGHTHKLMRQFIKEELKNNQFDLIHVETFYVMQNLPGLIAGRNDLPAGRQGEAISFNIPIILVEHNIEYQVYSRLAENAPIVLRPFFLIDVNKIKKEEENFWKKASNLVAVSDEDKKVMSCEGFDAEVVLNGVNPDQFKFKNLQKGINQKEKKILFIGDFKWIQNRDTLLWIIKDIWPRLRQGYDGQAKIKLWIVGRQIPDSIKNSTKDEDIIYDEGSSSNPTEQIFLEAYALLSPIRVGGGTSYKILESMSCGTPVIITPLSAISLGISDLNEALIGKTSQELADKTLKILRDAALYEKISKNGRALIEKKYTWESIAKKLNQVYQSVKV